MQLHEWEGFYVITGSSAAALTGLMFVVITLTAERVRQAGGALRAFATPTIVHFCLVLLLAGVMTTPSHTPGSLSWCVLAVALGALAYLGLAVRHLRRQTDYTPETSDLVWYFVLPAAAYALLLAAGLLIGGHPEAALRLIAVFTMALLLIGIHNAWDSAVWVTTMPRPPE
jgi:hypothetical protein